MLLIPVTITNSQTINNQKNLAIHVIPKPEHTELPGGNYTLKSNTQLYCSQEIQPGIMVFANVLKQSTGYKLLINEPDGR